MSRIHTVLLAVALLASAVLGRAAIAAASANTSGPHPCGDAALAVTATRSQGATGHSNFVLEFRNISGVRCTLRGYPGLDAIGKKGHLLKHAKRSLNGFTGGTPHIRTVLIRPGRFASADVEWMNFGPHGTNCKGSLSVNATPANTSYTVHLAKQVTLCNLQVHPTVAGKTGNGS
jgi:hypothetical protein